MKGRRYEYKVEKTQASIDGIVNCWRNVEGRFAVVVGLAGGFLPVTVIGPEKDTSHPQYQGGLISVTDQVTQLIPPTAPLTNISLEDGTIVISATRVSWPQKFLVPPGCYCQSLNAGDRMMVFYCATEDDAALLL